MVRTALRRPGTKYCHISPIIAKYGRLRKQNKPTKQKTNNKAKTNKQTPQTHPSHLQPSSELENRSIAGGIMSRMLRQETAQDHELSPTLIPLLSQTFLQERGGCRGGIETAPLGRRSFPEAEVGVSAAGEARRKSLLSPQPGPAMPELPSD